MKSRAMRIQAIFKRAERWPERENLAEREVLHVLIDDGDAKGHDLTVTAEPEIFEIASELDPNTPVALELQVEETLYRGSSARLKATRIDDPGE